MLMKIGEVTGRLGISHRSLHYWESAGILKCVRGENDYRFYDEDNKLVIQDIFHNMRHFLLAETSFIENFA